MGGMRDGRFSEAGQGVVMVDADPAAAAVKGLTLTDPDARDTVKRTVFLKYGKPAMRQHAEAGRCTEVDALNAPLAREVRTLGVRVPANAAIVAVIEGIEKANRVPGRGQRRGTGDRGAGLSWP